MGIVKNSRITVLRSLVFDTSKSSLLSVASFQMVVIHALVLNKNYLRICFRRGYFGIAVLPCQLRFGASIHGVDKAIQRQELKDNIPPMPFLPRRKTKTKNGGKQNGTGRS